VTIAWFHCFSGIAGDMALGALVDAGALLDDVERGCRRLGVDGWELRAEPVLRGGIAGTRLLVEVDEGHRHPHRRAVDIAELIGAAELPPRVESRALATFRLLAEVEGRLHGVPADEVHFHEVGAVDSIVDIVGVCVALELLGVDTVEASSVAQGTGTFRSAHGVLPNPPPAVVALLAGAGIPSHGLDVPFELTTPTGAALLAALGRRFGPLPAMTVTASGFGAGGRELTERANHVQVVLGTPPATSAVGGAAPDGQPAVVLEATVDDVTGETLAYAVTRLLEEGAHDAWLVPVVMKKGRPGHVVTVLADPSRLAPLRAVLREETGTLGVRAHGVERWPSARRFGEIEVEGHRVRMKVAEGRVKAEHDDVASAARALGLPLREVAARAEALWRLAGGVGATGPVGEADAAAGGQATEAVAGLDGADERDESARHNDR
jgi:uncharacterized protein (TIGR00299 family) protein